jgi:cell division protein FtsB
MRDFKKRRSRRGELVYLGLRALGVLVIFLITVLVVRAAWGMYGKLTEATQGQEEAQEQLATLQSQQNSVTSSIDGLSSSRGLETQVRERYDLAKPGEGEIDIVQDASSSAAQTPAPLPWWRHVFNALFEW